uniref:DNA-directed RNA polymerase subunit beta n=1 Tax=Heterosigma akashiwo TaxID=2829 RepID=A0A224AQD0_HETAK|nr:DNA-directed RNA polymerase beta subunit [Heterosigma akashiwo]
MVNNTFITKLPDFLEIQRSSFCWFLLKGLSYELNSLSPIIDVNVKRVKLKLYPQEFVLKPGRTTPICAKQNDSTYGVRIFLPAEVIYCDTESKYPTKKNRLEDIKEKVFIGQIPLMTSTGSFIVNGCERVIVNQIIRCPGLYYKAEFLNNNIVSTVTIIAQRGSWLKFEFDKNGYWVRIDKEKKISIFDFLEGLNINDEEILSGLKSIAPLLKYKKTQEILKRNNDPDLKNLIEKITDPNSYSLGIIGRLNLNRRLGLNISTRVHTLTIHDIFGIIDFFLSARSFVPDDIDDLRNRRIRAVGELITSQCEIGLNRLERNILERTNFSGSVRILPKTLVNARPIMSAIQEFFNSSQLSHYMDQTNLLSETANKRRISALGPGGLNADRVTVAARDIHPTQYGRLCPIETPEGQNVGLVSTLASYARINRNGFIQTPYFRVENGKILTQQPLIYLTAEQEENLKIAPADVKRDQDGYLVDDFIVTRFNQEFIITPSKLVDFISVSVIQIISVAASLIPFLEHDDANRALMGANMQRQAVPLLYPRKPIVGTGIESQVAFDSRLVNIATKPGIVKYVSSQQIDIKNIEGEKITYKLIKYRPSNQDTCLNQRPLVWVGQSIKTGQVIADGPGTQSGELALGQNLTVAYMPWQGYNYEDAILVSDKLVYQNLFTSIHIEECETEVQQTKTGEQVITSDIPLVSEKNCKNLDENGIIKVGKYVYPGDILVGKITPKGEIDQLPEAKLLKAIFGFKTPDMRDSSLRVPGGLSGRVLDIKIFKKPKPGKVFGVGSKIRVFIAQISKLQVGDKIAGRHGNKGVISRILPHQDMPFLPDGTSVDIILNPLGVPSRMNVGQIFECLLGLAGDQLNKRFKILPFDEMYQNEASRILINQKLKDAAKKQNKPWLFSAYSPGKILLSDGRTGEKFDNPVLVGRSYILKLAHLVEDKIHARSTGPYSLITQQPVGGKSQNGGQRFGEMEVWALEAFGAAYTLQELLTIKSDDMQGRDDVLNSIVCGQEIPKSSIPESFKVLMRELNALGLDITTYKVMFENETNKNCLIKNEINLMQTYEEGIKAKIREEEKEREKERQAREMEDPEKIVSKIDAKQKKEYKKTKKKTEKKK